MNSYTNQNIGVIPIIILNWNGISDTIECMESIRDLKGIEYHVYLVDNGSKGNEVVQLKKLFGKDPKITLCLNEENLGFAAGNNKMVADLLNDSDKQFKYFALLNNDTFVDPNWLLELVKCAEKHQAGMVSSKMINYFDRSIMDNSGHKMINTAEIVPSGHAEPIEYHTTDQINFGACAGAALYSRSMTNKIGLFDPHFSTGYEDAELGARAVICGYISVYASNAIVYHKISQSVNKIFDYDYLLHIQKNIFYSYFKLMPWPVILISIPSFIIKYLAIIVIDILFWRPKYLKIMLQTWQQFFTQDWSLVKKARASFHKNQTVISSFKILRMQEFFLWFDTKRFFKYVVLKKKSEFDKVHD